MVKALAVACAGLFLAALIMLFHSLIVEKQKKELEAEIEEMDKKIKSLNARNAVLERTIEMKERISNESESRIDNLHDGDALGNAVGILSKRKGQP